MADPTDTDDSVPPAFPPPGMQALLEECRRQYPAAFTTGPVPPGPPQEKSAHPLMDALRTKFRNEGLL